MRALRPVTQHSPWHSVGRGIKEWICHFLDSQSFQMVGKYWYFFIAVKYITRFAILTIFKCTSWVIINYIRSAVQPPAIYFQAVSITPNRNCVPMKRRVLFLLPPALVTSSLLPASVNVPVLDILCKWSSYSWVI